MKDRADLHAHECARLNAREDPAFGLSPNNNSILPGKTPIAPDKYKTSPTRTA
jgi:hypothetical protein